MIVIIIIAVLLVVMGIVVLSGKGDMLIAGYNIASEQERAEYDVRRLRLLIGITMFVVAGLLFLIGGEPSLSSVLAFSAVTVVLAVIVVALANTWAKKKTK